MPFTTNNTIVRTFRHAIALDERRAKFKVNHWNPPATKDTAPDGEGAKPQVSSPVQERAFADGTGTNAVSSQQGTLAAPKKVRNQAIRAMEKKYSSADSLVTDVEEVGCRYVKVWEHN